ncbi:cell division protein ZapA [Serpentinicella sp. ANB-PHB4]|uniref:cell division protein ZapA n=1 Tax=Serpentinicella sp. ANB-PHB4 TaxID=3074076 RepID=UPI00285D26C9|nr:cell division protein ZapA [Serpentinicella sp. ANB-PHB4]MDR5659594.1 cell division protein ZapA [Serpentinicella sp. ANB-PHB4]
MVQNKNKVYVKINGQEYPIIGAEPKDYLIKVGTFVDEHMKEITQANKQLSTSMAAVLTSINIADQYLKLYMNVEEFKKELHPKEEVESIKKQLDVTVKELGDQRDKNMLQQKQIEDLIDYKEKAQQEKVEFEEKAKKQEDEISKADDMINDLRNKLLENQMKLVETQTKLEEYINRNEKNNRK